MRTHRMLLKAWVRSMLMADRRRGQFSPDRIRASIGPIPTSRPFAGTSRRRSMYRTGSTVNRSAPPLFLLLVLSLAGAAHAQVKPKRTQLAGEVVQSTMWVGNSFFYDNNS